MNKYVIALVAIMLGDGAQAQSLPPDPTQRLMCLTAGACTPLPYEEAVTKKSLPIAPSAEASFTFGYVFIEAAMQTTAGTVERPNCGGFIIEEKRRLVVTAQHCLPPYAALTQEALLADGIPAKHVASIPEADLATHPAGASPAG